MLRESREAPGRKDRAAVGDSEEDTHRTGEGNPFLGRRLAEAPLGGASSGNGASEGVPDAEVPAGAVFSLLRVEREPPVQANRSEREQDQSCAS